MNTLIYLKIKTSIDKITLFKQRKNICVLDFFHNAKQNITFEKTCMTKIGLIDTNAISNILATHLAQIVKVNNFLQSKMKILQNLFYSTSSF